MDIDRLRPALARLSTLVDDDGLVGYLKAIIHFALLEVPACVGVSITIVDAGIPYTVSATDVSTQAMDGVQYLAGGPCVTTAEQGAPNSVPDVLDETRWHTYAQAAAATGIRSSLSLPLLFNGQLLGALNLYGSLPDAFDDRALLLAEMVSGHAALAIFNADLSMRTAKDAAGLEASLTKTPDPLVERAIGVLTRLKHLSPDQARRELRRAAARAGIEPLQLAESIVALGES